MAWLVRRKDRAGRPLLTTPQFLAGERLREDFTYAQMTPRMTASWDRPAARQGAAADFLPMTERIVAARKRVRDAIEAAGPEFGYLLLDVCCFLKGLADVERERQWPSRSAKLVLQLGLDRLARHYGLEARGRECAAMRAWSSELEN